LVVSLVACRDPAQRKAAPSSLVPSASAPSRAKTPTAVYPEASWDEVVRRIEAGEVVWIVPAAARRIFVTTRAGAELVASAPDDAALRALVDRVDPKRERLVVTRQYQNHREVRWREVPALLATEKVHWVQQNGRRRVILDMVDDEDTAMHGYITLQPRHRAIEPLLPEKHPSGLFVKRFDFDEITWPEAKRIMRAHDVSVSLAHVGRVIVRVKGSKQRPYLTIEPTTNDAAHWIQANKPGSLLSVE
jgi:hypothetical protein